MGIKNIIFDFGGVLIDWNPRYLYRNVFHNGEEMELFLRDICNSEWNLKQDAGRPISEATNELVTSYPQYKKEIKMYYTNWPLMIGGAIKENVSMLQKLKHSYRLFGLTNWSAETFPIVYSQYKFFKDLEGIVVSGEEKMTKPDERIYKVLLNRYKLKACESLFIDDNQENIIAASKLGFKTIYLDRNVNLKDELAILEL